MAELNPIEVSAVMPQNESHLSTCQCCALCKYICMYVCMLECPHEIWVKHKPGDALKATNQSFNFKVSNPPPTSQFVFKTEAKRQRMEGREREDKSQKREDFT